MTNKVPTHCSLCDWGEGWLTFSHTHQSQSDCSGGKWKAKLHTIWNTTGRYSHLGEEITLYIIQHIGLLWGEEAKQTIAIRYSLLLHPTHKNSCLSSCTPPPPSQTHTKTPTWGWFCWCSHCSGVQTSSAVRRSCRPWPKRGTCEGKEPWPALGPGRERSL